MLNTSLDVTRLLHIDLVQYLEHTRISEESGERGNVHSGVGQTMPGKAHGQGAQQPCDGGSSATRLAVGESCDGGAAVKPDRPAVPMLVLSDLETGRDAALTVPMGDPGEQEDREK